MSDDLIELSNEQRLALVAERDHKRPWYEIAPKDAVDLKFPNESIWGPLTEYGGECVWPWEPQQLVGVPMGQYRCPYCMAMCIAGVSHSDFTPGWDDSPEAHYAPPDECDGMDSPVDQLDLERRTNPYDMDDAERGGY